MKDQLQGQPLRENNSENMFLTLSVKAGEDVNRERFMFVQNNLVPDLIWSIFF